MIVIFGLISLLVNIGSSSVSSSPSSVENQQQKNILADSIGVFKINNKNKYEPLPSILTRSSLDQINGEQFVQLFDRMMDGDLTRTIEQIKNGNDKLLLIPPNKLTARQFVNLLDNYSSGLISSRLERIFPSLSKEPLSTRSRRSSLDTMTGYSIGYSKRTLDPMAGISFGAPVKRGINFDEIDRAGFSGFAKRRGSTDFDEMDHSGFAGFVKRRSSADFDDMDRSSFTNFAKRFSDFDEIDRSGFSGFAKRSVDFDEIDHSGFAGFAKRRLPNGIDFDEIDRSGFANSFSKRLNFDELDHSGFSGFNNQGKRFIINPVVDMINKAKLQVLSTSKQPNLSLVRKPTETHRE